MIRRAANIVQAAPDKPTTIVATGWILGWYVGGTAGEDQIMMASFEENQHGFVCAVPLSTVQFQDGLPAIIPEL